MIIWVPKGNYSRVLRTFCAMRDRGLLDIQAADYSVTTYELEVKCDRLTFINAFRIHSIVGSDSFAVFSAKELSEMTKLIQVALRLAITSEQTNDSP